MLLEETNTYEWALKSWSPCSKACGGGIGYCGLMVPCGEWWGFGENGPETGRSLEEVSQFGLEDLPCLQAIPSRALGEAGPARQVVQLSKATSAPVTEGGVL